MMISRIVRNWQPSRTDIVCVFLLGITASFGAYAESVYVKYRGLVDLAPFRCEVVDRSALVKRLCYDGREKYVIVNLSGTYYHYCNVPASLVADWREAPSMGRFYNAEVKGRFDCRIERMPTYKP